MKISKLARRCMFIFSIATAWLGGGAPLWAQHEHEHPVPEKLGTVSFPISCAPDTRKEFERAVALLHSFAYSPAEKAFRDIINRDPKCAMAHWGVAMTYVHPLWEPYLTKEDVARGRREVEQAKQLGGSDRERGFIMALELLYDDADTKSFGQRAGAYTAAMEKLAENNPNDVECQVFYALSLITAGSPNDQTHAKEKKAADLLEPLFEKYPDHPGIAHYLIHACDNPAMASRAVTAANRYSGIAPSAPHALHMPSHIYTRLGMWERSIASNLAARKAARDQGDIGEELHAMDYLTYAYLQIGGAERAARMLEDLKAMPLAKSNEFKVGYAATAMPVRYAIETRQWAEAARLEPIAGTQPHVFAITAWARSVGQARSGNATAAKVELDGLERAYDQLKTAGDVYWATQVQVQLNEARGWIAHAERKENDAIKLLRQAADQEDAVEKRPVTPGAIVPAREQLGDLFLELNLPKEALPEFERALTMTPNRRGAIYGRDRAKELINTAEKVQQD